MILKISELNIENFDLSNCGVVSGKRDLMLEMHAPNFAAV
jgi:hypothetical protein